MQIHIPTLMLALLVGFLLLTVQLAAAQRRDLQQPALRCWARGCWVLLGAFLMLSARRFLPYWLSVLLGNGLLALGILLYHQALSLHLLGRPLSWRAWLPLPAGLLWLGWSLLDDWTASARTVGASLLCGLLLLPSVGLLLRHGWRAEAALRTLTLTMALAALALLLRALDAWLRPEGYAQLLGGGLSQGLTFLVAFISLLGSGFGFVLACFERLARRMEEMAALDGMTGCLNRSSTDALLAHTLERGRREGSPVAFALLDLDHFKQINDAHGHRAGDTALRGFADEVRARLRGSDVLGRVGGEEFGIILPATDGAGAQRLIEAVRRAVAGLQLCGAEGQVFTLTVSAGVAVAAPGAELSADRLYALADAALYEAKRQGRNRVQLCAGALGGYTMQAGG